MRCQNPPASSSRSSFPSWVSLLGLSLLGLLLGPVACLPLSPLETDLPGAWTAATNLDDVSPIGLNICVLRLAQANHGVEMCACEKGGCSAYRLRRPPRLRVDRGPSYTGRMASHLPTSPLWLHACAIGWRGCCHVVGPVSTSHQIAGACTAQADRA